MVCQTKKIDTFPQRRVESDTETRYNKTGGKHMEVKINDKWYHYVVEITDQEYGHLAQFTSLDDDIFCKIIKVRDQLFYEVLEEEKRKELSKKYGQERNRR